MKTKLLLMVGLLLTSTHAVWSQSPQNNYVKIYKALQARTGDLSTVNNKNQVAESITYYDGLGRDVQSISRQGSPLGNDIVSFSIYDSYGKKTKSYLPYVPTQITGAPVSNPVTAQSTFYQAMFGTTDGPKAFSETQVERSELSRPLEQGAPGAAWQLDTDHTIKKEYRTNVAEEVMNLSYNSTTNEVLIMPGAASYYDAKSLQCNKTTDEGNGETLEFVDKEGRTVCKKVKVSAGAYASTYYVYDNFGNLSVVIQPEGSKAIENAIQP